MMSKKKTLEQAREEFLAYYRELLPGLPLEEYLAKRNKPVLLISPMHVDELQHEFAAQGLSWEPIPWFPQAIYFPRQVPVGTTLPGYEQGWIYSMNAASLKPVLALDPQPGESILDACAAPGGKAAAILARAESPALIANDPANLRFRRLRTALKLFGYPNVPLINHSAQALPHVLQGQFDKILLDAPCSSEKHVYNSKKHLRIWSPKRVTQLAHLQKLILSSLWPLLSPGGLLVYSTCALSPQENEEVVADYPVEGRLERYNDLDSELDPMFVAKLRKPSVS